MPLKDGDRIGNRFEFVVTAGARARQLMKGAVPRVGDAGKAVTVAQREVVSGEVRKIEPVTHDPSASEAAAPEERR